MFKYVVLNVEDRLTQILLISCAVGLIMLNVVLGILIYEVKSMRQGLITHMELQQLTVELIKQSAVTQNTVLEAMGAKLDGK